MAFPADITAAVAGSLAAYAGLEPPAWVIEARAAARIAALGITAAQYAERLASSRGASELEALIEAVRVGESRLFRHRSQIAALEGAVVPALRAAGRREVRVWSAGCAAGQEPYTLAAVLARGLPGCAISILATDLSAAALEEARRASYPAAALDDVPAEWRDAFTLDGDRLAVRPEIAALVELQRANLVDGPAPRRCDLVWCRNVLIYFTPTARRAAIQRLVAATAPGGFVFVGYSESLRDVAELEATRAGDAVYYVRRDGPAVPAPPPLALPARAAAAAPPAPAPPPRPAPAPPSPAPPPEAVLALRGHPDATALTAELAARLGLTGLARLIVDLDGCELLGDELAPVLRRARAAAGAAGVELVLRTTRTGARRWLERHALEGA